tara:strand:+ start:9128 stop:10522 length:1395 start_codon:yes stop_codon:yes gene_type:complete
MGLRSDKKTGVKSQLRERFPSAFKDFPSLLDARNASHATREQAFACIDGNVLMMSVPQGCRTLDSYIHIVYSSLMKASATAFVTIVVFDDPDAMTEAKMQEQMKRDASRAATSVQCSSDMQDVAESASPDDYTKEYIASMDDVHVLKENRGSRMRFFDEVAMTVLGLLKNQIQKWNASGHPGGHVVFDGVDPRGASRGIGEARVSEMVASSDEIATLFARDFRIGEGDLKLAQIGRKVREVAASGEHEGPLKDTRLSLCSTIDTDSFAIELIEEAKRSSDTSVSPVNTLLCMRERAKKRGYDDDHDAYYLCCDVSLLHALLQRHMWGINKHPTAVDQRAAMTLMVAGWGVCGCDFVEIKGMRSDVVFDSIAEIVKTRRESLALMQHSWEGERDSVSLAHKPIRELLTACASKLMEVPRIKKEFVPTVRDPDEVILKRIGWLCSYWNSVEHKGRMEEFGFVRPFA